MNKFVAIYFLSAVAMAVYGQEQSAFLDCATTQFKSMFVNITYIDGSKKCVEGNEDLINFIDSIENKIKESKVFYDEEADSVEKYDTLLKNAECVLEENNKLQSKVSELGDEATTNCIAAELDKATTRINNALACKEKKE
ncbi:uncharacterized protein [Atheta coriaria]|uniref:uncharacterized protein n=1 Tax=Dalotia coriaria TaxID=877792 RepID=UPI0031F37DDD